MKLPDHYSALGVRRFASAAAVRAAYLALMKQLHPDAPDRAADAPDAAQRISRAYWELRHPDRRAAYDAALRAETRHRPRSARAITTRPAPTARRAVVVVRKPPRQPRTTRVLFGIALILLIFAVGSAWHHRPTRPQPMRIAADLPVRDVPEAARPRAALIYEATADYQAMRAEGGMEAVTRYLTQCFTEMAVSAPAPVFDYCITLDSLGAAEARRERQAGFFDPAQRRARMAQVAFRPRALALARWREIDRIVTASARDRIHKLGSEDLARPLNEGTN